MDLRDFQILVELHRDPFSSNEAIGRAVGVSGTAVQERISRLEDRKVLRGFYVLPAAAIFGRHRVIAAFARVKATDPQDLEELVRVDDVTYLWLNPEVVSVNLFLKSADAQVPPQLEEIIGRPPEGVVRPDPPREQGAGEIVLSPLDWRVLEALFGAPRAPIAELSQAAGLTPRTVRKHRDALVTRGLIEVVPMLDTSKESGLIVYSGYVMVKRREDLRNIRAAGLARVWTHYDPPAAAILGHVDTFAEARALEQRLLALPGVLRVVFTIPQGAMVARERIRGWIRAERERWRGASSVQKM